MHVHNRYIYIMYVIHTYICIFKIKHPSFGRPSNVQGCKTFLPRCSGTARTNAWSRFSFRHLWPGHNNVPMD